MRQIISEHRKLSTNATAVNAYVSLPQLRPGQIARLKWVAFDNFGSGSVTFLPGMIRQGEFIPFYESSAVSSGGGRASLLCDVFFREGDQISVQCQQTGGGQDVQIFFSGWIDTPEPIEVVAVQKQ